MNKRELHPSLKLETIDDAKCQGIEFVVPPPPPMELPKGLPTKAIADSLEVLAQQPRFKEASELDRLVAYLFLRKEAVESSRLEGTMSTIDHILTPRELFDDWKAKSENNAVRGYAHALEAELAKVATKGLAIFTMDLVRRLHRGTMTLDPRFRGVPGAIRSERDPGDIVWIRGKSPRLEDSIYNPPPARHVRRCLERTMEWYANVKLAERGNAGMGLPLVVRMAIGHAHFEAIHPFSDGNGRVGRILFSLQMACQGKLPLYLSGYIEEQKEQYYKVLQAAQKKLNYAPIIEYFSLAIAESHREAQLTRKAIESLPEAWIKRGEFRKGSTAERALPWLITHPIFTAKSLQEQLSVSPQAANAAVELLCQRGIVRERTGFERNRVFSAEEVISLLSRRFGSDPDEALLSARRRSIEFA